MYDAVQVFAKALTDLDRSQDVQPVSIDCTGRETWQHGNSLVNYMKMVSKNLEEKDGQTRVRRSVSA